MTATRDRLLAMLADGRFHSGEQLGYALGISRAAVWKILRHMESCGLEVQAVRGRGYRLAVPLELLDAATILSQMNETSRALVPGLEIFHEIDSTNAYLMQQARQGRRTGHVCLAEWQRAGRGRRGRAWYASFGANLMLSVAWFYQGGPASLTGYSLAIGVAVARALQAMGLHGVMLKWPNDILCQGRKLGGVLVEMAGEVGGACHVVTGIGLNVRMPSGAARAIDQPWIDLHEAMDDVPVSRNRLAAHVLNEVLPVLAGYEQRGFAAYREDWQQLDACAGQPVTLSTSQGDIEGRALGIDHDGALLLRTVNGDRRYESGEVSLRLME